MAKRFKKFTTKNQGIRIMAFGFLFNFAGNAKNTVVQPVEETVKTKWFQEAIRDRDVDLIIVFGHVAIRSTEYDVIYKAIRAGTMGHAYRLPRRPRACTRLQGL